VAFSGAEGTRMVVWSSAAPVRVGLPVKQLTGAAAGSEVGDEPVLLETGQPLAKALDDLGG
jgi:hypothetical protein